MRINKKETIFIFYENNNKIKKNNKKQNKSLINPNV